MKRTLIAGWFGAVAASFILGAQASSAAIDIGANITVWDGVNTFADPFSADGVIFPGIDRPDLNPPLQRWDLEGFFLKNNSLLTMVGGYDHINGVSEVGAGLYTAGDIYIDIDGDAIYGDAGYWSYLNNLYLATNGFPAHYWFSTFQTNNFGYDYVIHFARKADGLTLDLVGNQIAFDVYRIDRTVLSETVLYFHRANPWRHLAGGTKVNTSPLYATYTTGLVDADVNFTGDAQVGPASHNTLQLDLTAFLSQTDMTNMFFHYTYECGNDLLYGKASIEPTPPAPCIDVEETIACALPNDACGGFGDVAAGYKGNQLPAFCYQITVTNCGDVVLNNVTINDATLGGNLTSTFFGGGPATLAPGQSITRYFRAAWAQNTTNQVTATGIPANSTDVLSANDGVVALVEEANITCGVTLTASCDRDGSANDNHVLLPGCGSSCDVTFSIQVCNPSGVDLAGVTIQAPALAGLGAAMPAAFDLPAGSCTNFQWTKTVSCTAAPLALAAQVKATVRADGQHCIYDVTGSNIVAVTSQCSGLVECTQGSGSICGVVLRDCDANGYLSGEAGLSGITVYLKNSSGTTLKTTTTDTNGSYCFTGLSAANYKVVVSATGYKQTYDPDSYKDNTTTICLASCENKTGVKFGYTGIQPGVALVVSGAASANCGDTVTFTFIVTNTGNTCLYGGVSVTAPLFGGQIYHKTPVVPGEVIVFTTNYVIKPGDSNPLILTATATGHPPINSVVTSQAAWTVQVTPCATTNGCTRTIGYYKNHASAITPLPIYLGTRNGCKTLIVSTQTIGVKVLGQRTYGDPSNGITKLYAQLLAAKLNGLKGADLSCVEEVIAKADQFLATHNHRSWSCLSSSQKNLVLTWAAALDVYNNGLCNVPHCEDNEDHDRDCDRNHDHKRSCNHNRDNNHDRNCDREHSRYRGCNSNFDCNHDRQCDRNHYRYQGCNHNR